MNDATLHPVTDQARARVIVLACAAAALAFGGFAALGSEQWVATMLVALCFVVAAWCLPLSLVALALAALTPAQLYFAFAGTFNLRGALLFVFAAALRVLVTQNWRARLRDGDWRTASIAAAIFLGAATSAAITAPNRYLALKGIYDWLPIFASAFVIGIVVRTPRLARQIVIVLIGAGVIEAWLGLAETALGLPRVLAALRSPFSELFFQPNLLRERIEQVAFNWIAFDRVLPFGTFINGIDFAIYMAALLALVIGLLVGQTQPAKSKIRIATFLTLAACAILFGGALLQTLKGSGLIALTGGLLALGGLSLPRWSPRTLALGVLVGVVALALAAPFYDAIATRVIFLIQRETGIVTTSGRAAIWAHLLGYVPARAWFGWGLNNTALLVEPLPSLMAGTFVFNTPTAESAYVAVLVETGVIGFVGLMTFLALALARAWRSARRAETPAWVIGVGAAIVALLCGSLTVVGLVTEQNGMLLGLLIGLIFSGGNAPPTDE